MQQRNGMANHVLLNNVDHKDLKVITTRSAKFGDDVMWALTFAAEFRSIQAHYPIFFRKDSQSGKFRAVAMFGFEDRENLFLADDGWDVPYVPLTIERQPFLIGFQQAPESDSGERAAVIHVDMDSPRVSRSEGEAVFMPHGGLTSYLDRINSILRMIQEGLEGDSKFVDALLAHNLLEAFTLDVALNDGSKNRLSGFYTINEDRLKALTGDTLARLNADGHLMPIYMVIASMSKIRDLIDRRNARLPDRKTRDLEDSGA
jgi:SapC